MELNIWAIGVLLEAYHRVYNDSATSIKDAKKLKKIIDVLENDRRKLTEVKQQ